MRGRKLAINDELGDKIMDYFYNNHDNRTAVIAKHFNQDTKNVSDYLDRRLRELKNYMGRDKRKDEY